MKLTDNQLQELTESLQEELDLGGDASMLTATVRIFLEEQATVTIDRGLQATHDAAVAVHAAIAAKAEPVTSDREALVAIFKTGWNLADNHGEVGHRTESGIDAVLAHLAARQELTISEPECQKTRKFDISQPVMDEREDERIEAWHEIASHPFFRECYATDGTLIAAMLTKLSAQPVTGTVEWGVKSKTIGTVWTSPSEVDARADIQQWAAWIDPNPNATKFPRVLVKRIAASEWVEVPNGE